MRTRLHSQHGAALVTSLIVLGVLVLMGLTAVMVSNSQFRMAGNLQFQSTAMSDAESALAIAENWLPSNFTNEGFANPKVAGLYPEKTAPDPFTMAWTDQSSIKVDPIGNQRYTIELYAPNRPLPSNSVAQSAGYGESAPAPTVNVYRVTARGVSRAGATRLVQSYYTVRTQSK
jgi:Tfp pilus assembly protein PilX